jgi:hypothetical protein
MDDVEQMIINQLRRTDRAIEARKKRIQEALKEKESSGRIFNKRYVLEFGFAAPPYVGDRTSTDLDVLPVTRSFVVDRDVKRFFCQELSFSFLVVGVPYQQQIATKVTIPWFAAQALMPFTWQVRDTSTDRDWSDAPLPSVFAQQGFVGGYRLPAAVVVEPGTEVQATVRPNFIRNTLVSYLASLSSVEIQFSFIGFEVL